MPTKQSPVGSTPPCKYCEGKGTYSRYVGEVGYADFGGEGYSLPPEIKILPCSRCKGTGITPEQPPVGPFVPADQEINNFAKPTPPEEKGKTLEEEKVFIALFSEWKGKWDGAALALEWVEKNMLSKHYARIEGELRDYREALRRIAKPALGGKEQQWIAQEALAKHTTSSPQGK